MSQKEAHSTWSRVGLARAMDEEREREERESQSWLWEPVAGAWWAPLWQHVSMGEAANERPRLLHKQLSEVGIDGRGHLLVLLRLGGLRGPLITRPSDSPTSDDGHALHMHLWTERRAMIWREQQVGVRGGTGATRGRLYSTRQALLHPDRR